MTEQAQGNTDQFHALLRCILTSLKGVITDLWMDHARWHKRLRVDDEFIAPHRRLVINDLPKYHLDLSHQERLWRTMHYEESTSTYYTFFEDFVVSPFKQISILVIHKAPPLCQLI